MRKIKLIISLAMLFLVLSFAAHAQQPTTPELTHPVGIVENYPSAKAYLSFIIPWATFNKNTTTTEFQSSTTVGFPVGVTVYYSPRFAFSYEITPTVIWQKTSGKTGTSKTSNLLFDPGPMFRFKHGLSLITRLAFETQGRYGFTPVLNYVYMRTRAVNYWFSVSSPVRFGNSQPASIGLNLQIGFTFN